ncbi:MAG: hypothetical protein JSW48_15005, partial [Betaproteobacteria bacterium]
MRCNFVLSISAACVAALALLSGCGDSGDQQQAASSGAAPAAPAAEKVTLKVASAFPSSLALVGEGGITFSENVKSVSGGMLEARIFEPGA